MAFDIFATYPVALAFVAALVLTPVVRSLARRRGMVVHPRADRWHKKPTAVLGGVAICAAVTGVYFVAIPGTPECLVVVLASGLLFLAGLVDDLRHLKPYQKLIFQVLGATLLIANDLYLPWTGSALINMAITIFWLVGITNAINLLDNMDGLAAGVAAIAAVFLGIHFYSNGQPAEALLLAVFTAALCGFLVYNSNPATIFMGDCGSMYIGFFLAGVSLLSHAPSGRTQSVIPVLAVPVLTLFLPIFDTTLVIMLRKMAGRSAAHGGRDHTSHRLVALGMSERRAVWMLYGFAALAGLLAMLVRQTPLDIGLAAVLFFVVVLALLGVHLAGVRVYSEAELQAAREKPLLAFLIDLSYKRRVFEVLLDVLLIILAFYSAYALRFGPVLENDAWTQMISVLPMLVFVKMGAFLALGVYRGLWRYVSVHDLVVFAKAVFCGSVAGILTVLFIFRFEGFSRVVFVLDGLILLLLLAGSRLAFRLFRSLLPRPVGDARRRVLIYGAGDGGELLLREFLNNGALRYQPIGFADDDPLKVGKVIHGLRVYGGNGTLAKVCAEQMVEEIVISSAKVPDFRIQEIIDSCHQAGVVLRRMRIEIETLCEPAEKGASENGQPLHN